VAFYRELGYLPAALVNYLGRLGWSMDDKSEIIPLEQMIANFSLERVNDSAASFDPDKLYWLAGEYMRMLPLEERTRGVIPYLVRAQLVREHHDEATAQKIQRVVAACGDRLKLFSDILPYGSFFFREPEYDQTALKKRVHKEGIPPLLREFADELKNTDPFETPILEEKLRVFCEQKGLKSGDMIHALRVSTTGITVGPGVFDCLAILGKEEAGKRIEAALAKSS
jgi:glutamyl-tRNA synthetase